MPFELNDDIHHRSDDLVKISVADTQVGLDRHHGELNERPLGADYRAKWGLPKGYPMVAPSYAAARSALAKQSGLGQGGRPAAKTAPVARGRAKKA